MNKKIINNKWFMIIVIVMACLVYCVVSLNQSRSSVLSEAFHEETLIEEAKRAVEYFNEHDYQNVIDMGNGMMDEVITVEEFEELCNERMEESGAFVEFTKTEVSGTKGQESDADYGIVTLNASYENGSQKFFVAFDTDMNLVGFQIQ